jgi:hypothetical protein
MGKKFCFCGVLKMSYIGIPRIGLMRLSWPIVPERRFFAVFPGSRPSGEWQDWFELALG